MLCEHVIKSGLYSPFLSLTHGNKCYKLQCEKFMLRWQPDDQTASNKILFSLSTISIRIHNKNGKCKHHIHGVYLRCLNIHIEKYPICIQAHAQLGNAKTNIVLCSKMAHTDDVLNSLLNVYLCDIFFFVRHGTPATTTNTHLYAIQYMKQPNKKGRLRQKWIKRHKHCIRDRENVLWLVACVAFAF